MGKVCAGFLDPILKVGDQPFNLTALGAKRGGGRTTLPFSRRTSEFERAREKSRQEGFFAPT